MRQIRIRIRRCYISRDADLYCRRQAHPSTSLPLSLLVMCMDYLLLRKHSRHCSKVEKLGAGHAHETRPPPSWNFVLPSAGDSESMKRAKGVCFVAISQQQQEQNKCRHHAWTLLSERLTAKSNQRNRRMIRAIDGGWHGMESHEEGRGRGTLASMRPQPPLSTHPPGKSIQPRLSLRSVVEASNQSEEIDTTKD